MTTPQIDRDGVALFWDLFRNVEWEDDDLVELRKIAHDGTWNESVPIQPTQITNMVNWLCRKCEKAAGQIGYFMCPGVLNDTRAKDTTVKALVALSIDVDQGDTQEAIKKLLPFFGKPTLVVHSGGYTDTGHQKVHIHYRLEEPETDTHKAAIVRAAMAKIVGGDMSFKRIPQVIRIAGSVYDKSNDGTLVSVIESNPDNELNFQDVLEIMEHSIKEMEQEEQSNVLDFSRGGNKDRLVQIATTTIEAGGVDDTRFDRFTEYAGRWIAHARSRDCDLDEAYHHVYNWTQSNMSPPWPKERIDREFMAILNKDRKDHAKAWEPQKYDEERKKTIQDWSWFDYVGTKQFVGRPDPVPFIVDQLIVEGSTHSLCADGGVGKTYVAMELALRCAIGPKEGNNMFSFPIRKQCVTFLITVEDSRDDLHRRIYNINGDGSMLRDAGDRFIVLPVADELYGGLTLVEKDQKGNHKPSEAWQKLVEKMDEVRDRFPELPMLIVVDTYSATHHGDENTSAGTNEWFRAASILKNKYNAALMVTHHIRKTDTNDIETPDQMRSHIRGSSAFINNCRINLGMWVMPGSKGLASEAIADPEEKNLMKFLNFAVLKSNVGLDWTHVSPHADPIITLRRTGTGQPIFDADIHHKRVTYKERKKQKDSMEMQAEKERMEAAVLASIKEHSLLGRPLNTQELRNDIKIVMPYPASELGRKTLSNILAGLVRDGKVVRINSKQGRTRMELHDTADGPYAMREETERTDEIVTVDWAQFEYDPETKEYHRAKMV